MLEESEEAMLRAWSARGDRDALDRLVRRLWPEAFRIASRCLGDHAAAEDAAQESCARLARGRAPSGGPGSVRRWFCKIVLNVVRNHLRARGRRSAHEARAGSERAERADAVLDGLETQEVRRRVGDLPCELREPLVLHFWGELPHSEVAETLGLSKSTTTWRIARGLETLRQALAATAAVVPLDAEAMEALVRGLQAPAAPAAPSASTILRRSGRRGWQRLGAGLVATALALGAAHLALADGDGLAPPVARDGADARAPEAPSPAAITSSVPGRAGDPGRRPSATQPAGEAASSPRAPDEELPRSDESSAPPGSIGSSVIEVRALATVAGRVVAREGGLPIQGADVTVFPLDDVEQRTSLDSSCSAHTSTSQDGAFRLALPAPWPAGVAGLLVTVRAPGRAPFMRLLPPEGRADLDLVLAPGGLALSGVVVAADGSALAGLRLNVVVPFLASTSPDRERPAEVQSEVLTGPDGRFWLDGLPESSSGATVSVLPGQGVLGKVSGYPLAEPPELRLVARLACRVGVRVVDASGGPVRGALVDLVDGRLVDVVDLVDEQPAERMVTDRDGRCAFESLRPRRHLVRVRLPMRDGAVSPAHESLAVDLSAAGQSVEVTAHLTRPPVPLTVCVADTAGTRRAGVGVLVIHDD